MGRGSISVGRRCVAVDVHQMLLKFDSADGGVDLQRAVEVGVVGAGQGDQELCRPGSAVSAVCRKTIVNLQAVVGRKGDEEPFAAQVQNVSIILDPVEAIAIGHLVLSDQNLVGTLEWRGNDETPALVVERGQNNGRRGDLLHAWKVRPFGSAPDDVHHWDGLGYGCSFASVRTRGRPCRFIGA